MKKYKLIKEYPNSPKLGTIIDDRKTYWGYDSQPNFGVVVLFKPNHPKDYPEYWEEVVEKDYEILSIYHTIRNNILTDYKNLFAWLNPDNRGKYVIHSVKRLSDGEIFTIGDKTNQGVINNILLVDNNILFNQYVNSFKNIQHLKQPLFTTEDGVDIFEGDSYILCRKGAVSKNLCTFTYTATSNINSMWDRADKDYKLFSTKEKAEEYIKLNSIRYSLKDIKEAFGESRTLSFKSIFNKLKQ